MFTAVYGSPNSQLRTQLWGNLAHLATLDDKPWMATGDFNDIANSSEWRGHDIGMDDNRIRRFNENISSCGLMDLGASGPKMTWSNSREGFVHTLKRLDRALGNREFRVKFSEAAVTNLPRTTSDHSPLLINMTGTRSNPLVLNRPFRLESTWFSHFGFKDMLSFNWHNCDDDHTTAILKLAESARRWNNNIFGNLFRNKIRVLARLNGVQKAQAIHFSHNLEFLERSLRMEYLNILNQKETMWYQKSRSKWIVEGDRNTRFFPYYYLV